MTTAVVKASGLSPQRTRAALALVVLPLLLLLAGPGLLLGDETALPTIGALMEGWTHGHPLSVLLEVDDAADARYLDEVRLPPDCEVTWLVRGEQPGLGLALVEAVKGLERPPAAVWGATEAEVAKSLRTYLKSTCGLSAQQGRVTGYWRSK